MNIRLKCGFQVCIIGYRTVRLRVVQDTVESINTPRYQNDSLLLQVKSREKKLISEHLYLVISIGVFKKGELTRPKMMTLFGIICDTV